MHPAHPWCRPLYGFAPPPAVKRGRGFIRAAQVALAVTLAALVASHLLA